MGIALPAAIIYYPYFQARSGEDKEGIVFAGTRRLDKRRVGDIRREYKTRRGHCSNRSFYCRRMGDNAQFNKDRRLLEVEFINV